MSRAGKLIFLFLLWPWAVTAYGQEPTINWGPKIDLNNRNLAQLQVVGNLKDGSFFTRYTDERLVTLELHNPDGQKLWSTVMAPRTPGGGVARFEDLILFNQKVYLLSSSEDAQKKVFYAQQIDENGNYVQPVTELVISAPGATLHTRAEKDRLVVALQPKLEGKKTTVLAYTNTLSPAWVQHLPMPGTIQDIDITEKGSAYILTRLPVTTSPENAFGIYRLEARNGRSSQHSIGSTSHRPLQAKLLLSATEAVVAGVTSPAPFVASQHPEPTGTFFYRFSKGNLRKPTIAYQPLDSTFLQNYKNSKPDRDRSQRLRNLELTHLMHLQGGKSVLLGEVDRTERNARHTDDIVVVIFGESGTPLFTTSLEKEQYLSAKEQPFGSYLATTEQDTTKLIYLDLQYNYTQQGRRITAEARTLQKMPVLATVLPDRTQQTLPLPSLQTGRSKNFYLIPASAYQLSPTKFLVLGLGNGYYKFGRLTF